MDNLREMTLTEIKLVVRSARDPVEFYKNLMTWFGGELCDTIRDELSEREDRLKLMRKDAKMLAIAFER